MESGPVEDPPLLVSTHRGEDHQSTEQQRSGDTDLGKQVQSLLSAKPSSLSTSLRLPLFNRYGKFVGPIHIVKEDVRECCKEIQDIVRLDNDVRLDNSIRPDAKVSPDNEVKPNEEVRSNGDVSIDIEMTTDDEVKSNEELRLDDINVADEDRPNPLQREENPDSEGECAMQGDIFEAAQSGDVQTVKNYLDLGIPPDLVDEQGWSILHHAASLGQVDIMRLLYSKGCCVDPWDRHGRTPLHLAASRGACASIGVLVDELGSEVNPVDEDGLTPLKWSVECEQYAVMEELLMCGGVEFLDEDSKAMLFQAAETGDVQYVLAIVESGWPIDVVDSDGRSALHWAAEGGAVEMIHFLIKYGLDVTRGSKTGMTALHVAAQFGHQDVVSTLVDAGCPIDVEDNYGWNVLHWAAGGSAVEMIHFLIKCDLDVNIGSKTGRTALHVAAQFGHQEVVSALVDAGCPIDVVDSYGWNALHWAAGGGASEIITFLIKYGLDVNRGSKTGRTALHVAAQCGHQEVVSTLVDAGCPIDVVDSGDRNALHWAARDGNVEIVRFLVNCGLDVNRKNKTGATALHIAAKYDHQEVVSTLVDAGCPIDVLDSDGWNALHWAASGGAVQTISFLIEGKYHNGLDVKVEDKIGYTPLHAACASCQPQAAFELLRHGALLTKVAGPYGTPLHRAAVKEDASLIDYILHFQPRQLYSAAAFTAYNEYPDNTNPLDVCDSFGQTPAFVAVAEGCLANLERLVANNCDIKVRSNLKLSIFENAIVRGHMSQLQAIANTCRVDAGSTSQRDLLRTLQAKDLLDPSKLLVLGAIGGDPLVIDFLFSEKEMFTAAAHQVWSDTYCRMLLEINFGDDDKDAIYDSLCLPSACPLTPLQIAVIFLKYRTEYHKEDETEIRRIVQTPEFIQKLISHPVSKFIVNVKFHNGLSPLDVAQQFDLLDIAEIIEIAGGRPGMWAELPKEVQIPAMKLFCSEYGHLLSSHGPTGLAALSRVMEGWVGVSPQLQHKSLLVNQQTSADVVLHQKPTHKVLIRHVLPRVTFRRKWRTLHILLDLEEDQVLKCCDQDDDDLYKAVLFAWVEHGSQVSWESLFEALDTLEPGKTVKEMRAKVLEELQPSSVTPPSTRPSALVPLPPFATHGVPLYRPALYRSREALHPHQKLMDKYRDRLLKVVPAKELVLRWYNHQLISDEVYYQTNPENVTPCKARDILFRYFWDHGTQQSFEKAFCQIMVEEGQKGYPQAAQLGRDMQEYLMTQLSPHH